jgi:hypothetical protein
VAWDELPTTITTVSPGWASRMAVASVADKGRGEPRP